MQGPASAAAESAALAPESAAPVAALPISPVHALRRRWKPHKERLHAVDRNHPTTIRFHRACSWLQRGADLGDSDHDLKLLSLWIGFNALYGSWDPDRCQPAPERETWQSFLSRLLAQDASQHLATVLQEHKPLVMSILEDEYLSGFFWGDPGPERAGRSKRVMYDARTWYVTGRWGAILDRVMDRIYFLRCQLVHGAATHGGQLNRQSLRRCVTLLEQVLIGTLQAFIDHGSDVDWGLMCYPPLRR